jgi:hypothetical protein
MLKSSQLASVGLLVCLAGTASAQTLTPAGVVTAAQAARAGSSAVSEGATIFSGDLLKTEGNGSIQVQAGKIKLALGENSSMRIFRQENRTIVELERGLVSYAASGTGESITLYAQDVKFVPDTTKPASGQITIRSRCELGAAAVRSSMEITSGKESKTLEESKSFTVTSEVGIDYRDSWTPMLSDYPDFPREAAYHHSHAHTACPAAFLNHAHRPPLSALATGHFRELAIGVTAVVTAIVVDEALESPDRP